MRDEFFSFARSVLLRIYDIFIGLLNPDVAAGLRKPVLRQKIYRP